MPHSKRKRILEAALKGLLAGADSAWWLKGPATFIVELSAKFEDLPVDQKNALARATKAELSALMLQTELATDNAALAAAGATALQKALAEHAANNKEAHGQLRRFLAAFGDSLSEVHLILPRIEQELKDVKQIVLTHGPHVLAEPSETEAERLSRLYAESGPWHEVRTSERHEAETVWLWDRKYPLERLYHQLPLLQKVEGKELPHEERGEREDPRRMLRETEIYRWEEQVLQRSDSYEPVDCKVLLQHFSPLTEKSRSPVPRFVLLGPPGSGKSTLQQHLALQSACGELQIAGRVRVPIRIRLTSWEKDGPEASLLRYLHTRYRQDLKLRPTLEQWRRALENGDLLLLLDGLDELRRDTSFEEEAIQPLLRDWIDCPVILACRTISYEQHKAVCGDLPVYLLGPMDDDNRRDYVNAYPATDHFEPQTLIEQLQQSPQLLLLSANPLLLSLICYTVDRPGGLRLPATRGDLYQNAIHCLLVRRPPRRRIQFPGGHKPAPHQSQRILEALALEMFLEEARVTIDPERFDQVLRKALSEAGYGKAAANLANAIRDDLLHNTGILREDADRGYFFLHLTLQEFLTASALCRLINEQGWSSTLPVGKETLTIRQLIDRSCWRTAWAEVIPLLAGRLNDPKPLLELLLAIDTDERHMLATMFRPGLILAATCVGELHKNSHIACSDLCDKIVTELLALHKAHVAHNRPVRDVDVADARQALLRLTAWTGFVDRLISLSENEDPTSRKAAAELLALFSESTGCRVRLALTKLSRDTDGDVRIAIAEALGRGGHQARANASELLIGLAQDEDEAVRSDAAHSLGRRSLKDDPRVSDVLAALARQPWTPSAKITRRAAGEQLRKVVNEGRFTPGDPVSDFLVRMYSNCSIACMAALEALGELGSRGAKAAIGVLMDLARAEDETVRKRAVTSLAKCRPAELSDFINVLLKLARDQTRSVCVDATRGIAQLAREGSTEALDALLALVNEGRIKHQGQVTQLGTLGMQYGSSVVDALMSLVQPDSESDISAVAIRVLGALASDGAPAAKEAVRALMDEPKLFRWAQSILTVEELAQVRGHTNPEAVEAFLRLVGDEVDVARRVTGASSSIADTSELKGAIDAMLVLASHEEAEWRGIAAIALGRLASHSDAQVIDALLNLAQDPDATVCSYAALALGRLRASCDPRVIEALMTLARSGDQSIREAAVQAFDRFGAYDDPEIVEAVLALGCDQEEDVRRTAVPALYQLNEHVSDPRVFESLLQIARSAKGWNAVWELGELGMKCRADSVPAVIDALLEEMTEGNRNWAEGELAKILARDRAEGRNRPRTGNAGG